MDIKPILFSTPMVQAILAGRKTQTRRIVKSRHESGLFQIGRTMDGVIIEITSLDWDERPKNDNTNDIKPRYRIGDIMWVRETWTPLVNGGPEGFNLYGFKADNDETLNVKWKPSIFMPKEAARIYLQVTNVKIERIQDISFNDIKEEGIHVDKSKFPAKIKENEQQYESVLEVLTLELWMKLWSDINGKDSWKLNPYVWVYEFKRIDISTIESEVKQ